MATNYIADTFKINPFEAFRNAFGYRALPFPLETSIQEILGPGAKERLSNLGAALYTRDKNGQEAFCPVVISYQNRKFNLPFSTIAVSMRKIIEKTTLPARRGSVKELIAKDDYVFTIRGVLLSDEELPQDELADLRELYEIDAPVNLENAFSEIFLLKENQVVIDDIDLPDMRGVSSAQAYTIRLSSDTILELEVQDV